MLEASDITFAYGDRQVLNGASLSAKTGEVVALVGANGAGKTTLIRILASLLYPDAGKVLFDSHDIFGNPVAYRRILGYLPETAPIEYDMQVRSYLQYRAKIKGEQPMKIRHRVLEAMELCGILELDDAYTSRLSLGQRKRVAIAEAVLLRPRCVILDDPFAGLDLPGRKAVVKVISALSSVSSVVISGHELDAIGEVAGKIMLLQGGVLKRLPDVGAVKEQFK